MTGLRARLHGHRNPIALTLIGLFLLAQAGIVWHDRDAALDPGRAVIYEAWPVEVRLAGWLATGLVAVIAAWTPRRHIGWIAAFIMPAQRFLAHGWSALHWVIPGYPPGVASSASWALLWAAMCGLIYLLAGWADTAPTHTEEH